MPPADATLLQRVAERILVAWLEAQGKTDIAMGGRLTSLTGRSVDVSYALNGRRRRIKIKPDTYFGVDEAKIRDRSMGFYRADVNAYALETVADALTRQPGWMFDSHADDLYYYYLTIGQPHDEIEALAAEPDQVFFSELAVERDELTVLPMHSTREWFAAHQDGYAARPVMTATGSSWYRLVPRDDLHAAVGGINRVGPVFRGLVP